MKRATKSVVLSLAPSGRVEKRETNKWVMSRENVSSGIFDQVRFKPVCSATEAS